MFRPQYAECILLSELHYTTIFYTAFVIADSLNLRVVCPQRTALSNLPMELAWRKKVCMILIHHIHTLQILNTKNTLF